MSISAALRRAVAYHASRGRTALIGPGGALSYAALGTRIDRAASIFAELTPGEPVALLASRTPDAVALLLGVMQAGGCPSFVDPNLGLDTLVPQLRAADIQRVILHGTPEPLAHTLDRQGLHVHIPHLDDDSVSPVTADTREVADTAPALWLFTSGSSGRPKEVVLTHGNLLAHAHGIITRTGLTAVDRLLHVMPWHHTNGVNNQLIAPLFAGASVVLIDRFHAADIPSQLEEFAPTILTGVPTMYARILNHLGNQLARTALRMLRCGSAPLNTALHTQIEKAFQIPLIVSYGLSEATCTSAMNPPSARRIGSVGTALRGQEIRLFVPESTEMSRPGTEGEIGIGGACVMRGYRNRASDSPVAQGWLRTGDIGRLDDDGYLYVTGRLGEAILRGGENLSPQLIEDALTRHPSVAACCVVGAPHADLGETPVAFVRLHRTPPPSAGELRDLVTQQLSRSYAPGDIRFVAELPENSVGKVDRRALREILASAAGDTRTPK